MAFNKAHGGECPQDNVLANLSLMVRDGEKILAAAFAVLDSTGCMSLQVTISKEINDTELLRALIDKSLLKLRSNGVSKITIHIQGDPEGRELWPKVDWLQKLFESEAA